MSLEKLNISLVEEVEKFKKEGRAKHPERVISGFVPPVGNRGYRYMLEGYDREFIRMNSNSYLGLSHHPEIITAADKATHRYGLGPGAVRFIDGTLTPHVVLEERIASFVDKPAAKIFNSAYTSNLALALTVNSPETFWIGDEFNHNSIIRAMRISNVPRSNKAIYAHNDMQSLEKCLESVPKNIKRVCVIFDGIFSMRGDCAPIADIKLLANRYCDRFEQGVITIVDDSHGIGAFGNTGRGSCEYTDTSADIIVGTFGKAFGINGGFVAGSKALTEAIRQKADTYIYTNPLSAADCAAAKKSIDIVDSQEGLERLKLLQKHIYQFREGLKCMGIESIEGPHPVVPMLMRSTKNTHRMVHRLFEKGILMVGLTFPVVPEGSETIRVQINAGITSDDISYVLDSISIVK